ncbi:hypothetical protein Pelo_6736 [Pelomyxa schiedti]|nr:hypothetical protein Pelo_6736 [Pelomyxa schiedti]
MRTGKLFVPPSVNTDAVYNEAEYYQIQLPDRQPPQPTQPPACLHDYVEFAVSTNSGTAPTNSDLNELVSSMPLQKLSAGGIGNVVTYIEAHSAWRVKSWTKLENGQVYVYLFKTSSS